MSCAPGGRQTPSCQPVDLNQFKLPHHPAAKHDVSFHIRTSSNVYRIIYIFIELLLNYSFLLITFTKPLLKPHYLYNVALKQKQCVH